MKAEVPIYVDGCYVISAAWEAEKGIRELKRLRREYNTPHLKVHTLKLFMDGTLKLHSGAMVTPYVETGEKGCNAMNLEEVVSLLKVLNEEGLDFHVHTVGEASSRLKMREWELKRCCWDIRLTAQSSSALKRRRAPSRPARMRTSWYSGPTCSRRSMRALATTSRKPSILPDGR